MYTQNMNSPRPNANAMVITISTMETLVMFSRKLDLNMSEKEVMAYILQSIIMCFSRICDRFRIWKTRPRPGF